MGEPSTKASSLRWRILRESFLRRPSEDRSETCVKLISRRATHGFNLIPYHLVENIPEGQKSNPSEFSSRDVCLCYTVPITGALELHLYQRVDDCADLNDFEICNKYNIDNTGLVCSWPSEDVLAYYCLSNADIFRSKRVIELGSGYGLAGLVIAAFTKASEVVISDGNPRVVDYMVTSYAGIEDALISNFQNLLKSSDIKSYTWAFLNKDGPKYIQRNINANSSTYGDKLVKSVTLHWDQKVTSDYSNSFDLIVASDCTFFKDFHRGLAQTIKSLLKKDMRSQALFFSPKRGDSLDTFLDEISNSGLHFSITEIYDTEIWNRHQQFITGNDDWPNYEKDHCYPLLITITF